MIKIKNHICVIILLCGLFIRAHASFENIGFGIRPAGLGQSYVAMGDDVNSIFYNPAGIGRLRSSQAIFQYDQLFMGLDDGSSPTSTILGYAFPLNDHNCVAGGYYSLTVPSLYSESMLMGTYSMTLNKRLIVGGTGKILMRSIGRLTVDNDPMANRSTTAFDIDFGVLYKYVGKYVLGAAIRNFIRSNLAVTGGYDDKAPQDICFAAGYRERYLNMNLEFDIQQKMAAQYTLSGGAEQWFVPSKNFIMAIRSGLMINTDKQYNFSVGLSYVSNNIQVDYALKFPLSGIRDTMGSHFIGVTYKFRQEKDIMFVEEAPDFVYVPPKTSDRVKAEFDAAVAYYQDQASKGMPLSSQIGLVKSIIEKYEPQGINVTDLKGKVKTMETDLARMLREENRNKVSELYKDAIGAYKEGDYNKALGFAGQASALNPEDMSIKDLKDRLQKVGGIIPELKGTDQVSMLLKKAIVPYFESDPAKSILILRYFLEKYPSDVKALQLLKTIEGEYPAQVVQPYDPRKGIVNQKLENALADIYDTKYEIAIRECNEVLDLEPNNDLALTRIGSAYFALGQVNEAKDYWKKALSINPRNSELNQFLGDKKIDLGVRLPETSAAGAAQESAVEQEYVIQKGDTLPKISEKVYGDKSQWKKIYEANRNALPNPYALVAGRKLTIPGAGASEKKAPAQVSKQKQGRTYKVVKGDSLMKIAEKVYSDKSQWKKIYEANRNKLPNPYSLKENIVLSIP